MPSGDEASRNWCRRSTREHAKSFYFASFALPREKRDAAYAVYAFCRYADDVMDEAGEGGVDAIGRLGETFDAIVAGQEAGLPFAEAFSWAVRRFGIPKDPFMELLEGVARDRGRVRVETWPELRDYCWHVASTVGLIMARIFEVRDEGALERAADLGIAMQLTNILRDIREDLDRDRVYLPAEELDRFGVGWGSLEGREVTPAFKALMRFQIGRAREYYAGAEPGIAALADDGSQFTVWVMRHVYAGILDEIERAGHDVFSRRVATSLPRKLALAARAWKDMRARRRGTDRR